MCPEVCVLSVDAVSQICNLVLVKVYDSKYLFRFNALYCFTIELGANLFLLLAPSALSFSYESLSECRNTSEPSSMLSQTPVLFKCLEHSPFQKTILHQLIWTKLNPQKQKKLIVVSSFSPSMAKVFDSLKQN